MGDKHSVCSWTNSKFVIALCLVPELLFGARFLTRADEAGAVGRVLGPAEEFISSWRDLRNPVYLSSDKEVVYYTFHTSNRSWVHLVVANYKSGGCAFRPVVTGTKSSVSVTANRLRAIAAVNAAYFNLSDGLSVGYVYVDGKMIADPQKNLALYKNEKLKLYLPAVFNRTEVRFLKNACNKPQIQIACHLEPLPPDYKLVDSLQAGPRLLPAITEEEEAFVRQDPDTKKIVDSINSHKCAARTAFGVTGDGYALVLCTAGPGQNRGSAGITLAELADLLKRLGCVEAVNFDGGASTTMTIAVDNSTGDAATNPVTVVCGKEPETRVKSALVLVRRLQ